MAYILLLLLVLLIFYVYVHLKNQLKYWKKLNVENIPAILFFGNIVKSFFFVENLSTLFQKFYMQSKSPYIGIFIAHNPALLIKDVKLIRKILVEDFSHFVNRTVAINQRDDPNGTNMLFLSRGSDWKKIRNKIITVFSSSKLRVMSELVQKCGENMTEYLNKKVKGSTVLDTVDICQRYSTDAITSIAFGVDAQCFKNENGEFLRIAKKMFNCQIFERAFSLTCYFMFPLLVKLFRLKFVDKESTEIITNAFWEVLKAREASGAKRNDLVDVSIDLLKKNCLEKPLIVSQSTQFLVAGFETTGSTIGFCLYELAKHQNLQESLRKEILNAKPDGFSYNSIMNMKHLDRIVKETLRMYPVVPYLERKCVKTYRIPGTTLDIEEGVGVYIPLLGLHYDPDYFPNPNVFDPERHTDENSQARPPHCYMPFGDGPRKCIGDRLALLNVKLALCYILSNFVITTTKNTPEKIDFYPAGIMLTPTKKFCLAFTRMENVKNLT